ncbi:MAG: OmpA family protein [Bacteroidota bacterium]
MKSFFKKKIIISLSLLLTFNFSTLLLRMDGDKIAAQNIGFTQNNFVNNENGLKEAQSNIKKGDGFFNGGTLYYKRSLEYYLKANAFNPENALLNYKIGVCYLYSAFKQNAIQHLEKAKKLDPTVSDAIDYYFGRYYHLNMKWNKAIELYELYKKSLTEEDFKKMSDAKKKIQECKNGIELMKDTIRLSKLPDSLRYRIENLSSEVNSKYPDYRPLISADESVLIFTSRRDNTTGGGIDQYDQLYFEDIYISRNENKNWSEAKNIGDQVNSYNTHDATCGLAVDGQKLFIYKDDLDKGSGNIYECALQGNNWSSPKKLKSTINSRYHEASASLSPDGKTLYFTSENPKDNEGPSLHDIFKSVKDEKGEWSEPENLGPIINTQYDERTVFIHPDGKTLYFSSQGHNSIGGFDLFKSVFNDSLKKWSAVVNLGYPINSPDDDVDFVVSASGKHAYYSTIRSDGLGEKDIYRITLPADTTTQLTLVKGFVTDESNNPVGAKIDIIDNKTGKIISTQESNSASGKFLVSLPSGKSYKMQVVAEGYYPHTENFNIPKGAKYKELDINIKLKRKEQKVSVEGNVFDENKKPLKATIEIINNATGEVVGKTTADELGKFLLKLQGGKNYGLVVSAEGYLFQSINLDIPPNKDHFKLDNVVLKKIQKGKNIVLNNIFFDFDKASLRPDSKPELDRVVKILQENPTMKIEISGHTDNKGSATYNLKLSESRAKSVVDYISTNGVEHFRLTFKGYGFVKPIATNETEEGRQMNRRTEFKVVDIDENATPVIVSTQMPTTTPQPVNTNSTVIVSTQMPTTTPQPVNTNSTVIVSTQMPTTTTQPVNTNSTVIASTQMPTTTPQPVNTNSTVIVSTQMPTPTPQPVNTNSTVIASTQMPTTTTQPANTNSTVIASTQMPTTTTQPANTNSTVIVSTQMPTTTTQPANTNSTDTTGTIISSSSKIPAELSSADTNNDGSISASEISAIIEGFFEGTNDFSGEKLHRLIDYFFEQ